MNKERHPSVIEVEKMKQGYLKQVEYLKQEIEERDNKITELLDDLVEVQNICSPVLVAVPHIGKTYSAHLPEQGQIHPNRLGGR